MNFVFEKYFVQDTFVMLFNFEILFEINHINPY